MKLTLDNKDLTDGFFEETRLLGIQAPIKDYMFCWQINQLLGIDFRINNELEIPLKRKGRIYFFAVYEYALYRKFEFKDFSEAFAFMTRVALIAEKINHHPRWTNVWNTVEVWLNTHDAGDIVTDKDRKLAEKIDAL